MSDNQRLDKWKKLYEQTNYENMKNEENYSPTVKNDYLTKRPPTSYVETIHYVPVSNPVVYVGFWRRFFASFIDAIITSLLTAFTDHEWLIFILAILYFTLLTASPLQGTIGKVAIGAIVVDTNGNQISIARSLGRYISYFISSIILLFGFIMIAFHGEKRGLHDLICGTKVINKKS
jgi:hypothetical protein